MRVSRITQNRIYDWVCAKELESDARALGSAFGLFVFFIAIKVHLAWWFIGVKHMRPDIQLWKAPFLIGTDLFVSGVAAIIYFSFYATKPRVHGLFGAIWGQILPFLVHLAMVIFAIISWQVTLIYATPLSMDLVRAADDLGNMRDSLLVYLNPAVLLIFAFGIITYFSFRRSFGWILHKIPLLSTRWRLWIIFLVTSGTFTLASLLVFRAAYEFGLKRNAIEYFIRYYTPAESTFDIKALHRELEPRVKGLVPEIRASESIVDKGLHRDSELSNARNKASGMNVVFIMMESTSAQYVSRETTPNLFRLADSGISFQNYFTTTSMTDQALYSALYSDNLPSFPQRIRSMYSRELPQSSLAKVLKDSSYQTGYFMSGELKYSDVDFFLHDFELRKGAREICKNGYGWGWGALEEWTVKSVTEWISKQKGNKFFCIYSTIFPHHPYFTPDSYQPYGTATWKDKYVNALKYTDRNIGQLLDFIEKEKLRDSTLIVLTGDHGETVSSYPCGHGIAFTLEELRVPLLLSNPQIFKSPRVSRLQANHLDFAPTIAGLLGLASPDEWLGRNLAAAQVPSRVLHVNLQHSRISGALDGNRFYAFDAKSQRGTLYSFEEDTLRELPPDKDLGDAFTLRIQRHRDWAVWRHLDRALRVEPASAQAHASSEPMRRGN